MQKFITIILILLIIGSCDTPDYELNNEVDNYIQELESPALFFYPHQAEVALDDTAFIQVYALEVDSAAGIHLKIQYDWGSVQLEEVLPDDFFIESDDTLLFYEDTDGTVDIHLFFLPNGTIALCALVFSTHSLGESELRFSATTKVVNPRNERIQINELGDGRIDVK